MPTQGQSQSTAIDEPADKMTRNSSIAMVAKPAGTLLNWSLPQIRMHSKTVGGKVDLEAQRPVPQRAAQTGAPILCREISCNAHSVKAPLMRHKAQHKAGTDLNKKRLPSMRQA
jgi:hypothetical protein